MIMKKIIKKIDSMKILKIIEIVLKAVDIIVRICSML